MIRTVVPTGGKVTPVLLLGWASAELVSFGTGLDCVALAFGDEAEDDDDPVLAPEEAVFWVAVPDGAPVVVVVELDDPPHAVSSSTSEPSPVATVHPLLRITCLSLHRDPEVPGPVGDNGLSPLT